MGVGGEEVEVAMGQATVPGESRVYVSIYGFWRWGTSAIFDMQIFNLDVGSYLQQASAKALSMA